MPPVSCSTSREGATLPARLASRRRIGKRRLKSGWRGSQTVISAKQGSSASPEGTFLQTFVRGHRLACSAAELATADRSMGGKRERSGRDSLGGTGRLGFGHAGRGRIPAARP
ncbi:hypothetical protein J2Z33_003635 [Rubellimicrobium aerolatum]|nr:hypothetical protein [Rubellimicrobium aerolatum]